MTVIFVPYTCNPPFPLGILGKILILPKCYEVVQAPKATQMSHRIQAYVLSIQAPDFSLCNATNYTYDLCELAFCYWNKFRNDT